MEHGHANFHLDDRAYEIAVGAGKWNINDLPAELAEQVRPFLNNSDAVGVFASGTNPPVPDKRGFVAGIEWIRFEPEVSRSPDEGPLNFYAYVVGPRGSTGYPVYGPFTRTHTIAPHHGDLEDIDRF